MNRHERRRACKIATENNFFTSHIQHLPRVPLDAPLERGRLYHTVIQHDDWCAHYDGNECNCSPIISQYVEPRGGKT